MSQDRPILAQANASPAPSGWLPLIFNEKYRPATPLEYLILWDRPSGDRQALSSEGGLNEPGSTYPGLNLCFNRSIWMVGIDIQ